MLFKVFPDLLVKCFHFLMIKRALSMRFSACALQARADALEGNLFKMCSWGGRITRYWIKYCRDYASSAEAVKIGINAK